MTDAKGLSEVVDTLVKDNAALAERLKACEAERKQRERERDKAHIEIANRACYEGVLMKERDELADDLARVRQERNEWNEKCAIVIRERNEERRRHALDAFQFNLTHNLIPVSEDVEADEKYRALCLAALTEDKPITIKKSPLT
jgi:hypothetical protein